MRIGIDGRPLCALPAGIGRYVVEICRQLDSVLPEAEFYVYSNRPLKMPVPSSRWHPRVDGSPLARFLRPVLWLKLRCGSLCRGDKLDSFWGTAHYLPNLPTTIKQVLTVYDLIHKVCPETMTLANLWCHRLFFARDLKKAHKVLTISQGTSQKLLKYFDREADAVIRPAVGACFRPFHGCETNACLQAYGIVSPYFLSVATWNPRKNLELLLRTFLSLKSEGLLPGHKLVLVGGKGWKDRALSAIVSGNRTKEVLALGYVPDERLPALYTGAEALVFPSLYEGYGIPVAEALACGTRVVASDLEEIREAGGDKPIYINPTADGIRAGLLAAIAKSPVPKNDRSIVVPPEEDPAVILANVFLGN